ncbi:hypothetical protein E5347_13990 [Clostridium sartagoforme]|uniref:Glyoxalase-like domain-containing protein n=1 Tax=Clostridium sartagoforme TaxID=84031 RepID=A0A4S2DHF0_9CLOT|nr:hypothetical protein [Clostridium sartagoforme]TGY40962.1 hypothetical protein E5347_13990 [Clostridium sartagoforme]
MFKLDHFVVNINGNYQKDKDEIKNITEAGFPYEPSWGKGTKGFKASNLWIGNEYFEMINIIRADGGGWKEDWVELYNKGYRGLICLMLDVEDIDKLYKSLTNKSIGVTKPEYLKLKWFFNLLTRTMPWRNSYINFFEGIPMQIGFQQMKDEKSRDFMDQYMVPNSRDNDILGINKVVIRGPLTSKDINLIKEVFEEFIISNNPLTIKLNQGQVIIFEDSESYSVEMFTQCKNENYISKSIKIENIIVNNEV